MRRLGEDDIPAAAALLARGFAEEPGNRAMVPDPELRERLAVLVFTHQLHATVPYTTAFGAELDGELGGAALWHAPKATTASAGSTWHLAFLATDPQLRGRGLARCLLDHVLNRCDQDGLAAWLETTDPVNPPLYERFGFRTVGHVDRAGWIPGLWVMRRDPVGGSTARR